MFLNFPVDGELLGRVLDAGKRLHDVVIDFAVAVIFQDLLVHVRNRQRASDLALVGVEAGGNPGDIHPVLFDQVFKYQRLVRRVHGGARRVLGQCDFCRVGVLGYDQAGKGVIPGEVLLFRQLA